jgi:hypothetical protein
MQLRRIKIPLLVLVILCAVITSPVAAYQFSMTSSTVYYQASTYPSLPYATEMHNTVSNWLTGTPGWTQTFYHTSGYVDDTDFGTTGMGLNQAELHYHYGHGGNDGTHTYLPFLNWPTTSLYHSEVLKKWDATNKWVILDACGVLTDTDWGGALKYSHGLLGFTSNKTPSTDLPDRFLRNTIDNDYTISYSWQRATQATYDPPVTARVIFDTNDQLQNDHLSGQGSVAANEAVDDNTIYVSTWAC